MELTDTVREQFEEVRQEGQCNMFDRICVANRAAEHDSWDLYEIASDRRDYGQLLQALAADAKEGERP